VCVDCGEEYRPEIAVCADCGGQLEDRYALEHGTAPSGGPAAAAAAAAADPGATFSELLVFDEAATRLVEAADRLVEQGIACRVRPDASIERAPAGDGDPDRDARAAARHGYWLCVRTEDLDAALAALGLPKPGAAGHVTADGAARACPACEAPVPAGVVECPGCGLAVGDDASSP
jgi:hypothetical protein